ncbi:MAG TPA: C40 family peptidase [Pyrinomonadaceae bacterium]|nr:C40 family peptidase [Pyrinomonadaceae bacterium]
MVSKRLFPYALAACFTLGMIAQTATAQKADLGLQLARANAIATLPISDDEPVIVSLASAEDIKASGLTSDPLNRFKQLMTAAIDQRLGAQYVWGATGPSAFDCSGFVWSAFKSAGIDFERGSARTLWARFAAPAPGEQYKFGTLVFFSNLSHIGIVADEHGFYHASRHHGVVYSPFNDYWLSRIDGFRQVPMTTSVATD